MSGPPATLEVIADRAVVLAHCVGHPPEVGKTLKANGARLLGEMEELTGRTIIVKADPTLHQEQFDIQ